MTDEKAGEAKILVVGGGISGITTAVEAAEVGHEVVLVEKRPYLGGRISQMNQYFPKLCPPSCGLEINLKRIKNNQKIQVLTLSEVEGISGQEGDYEVSIKIQPRYVNENCTCCDKCAEVCSVEIENEFNYTMDKVKGAYLPHEMAYPMRYVIAPEVIGTEDARRCKEACQYNAIDLDMQPKNINFKVSSVVLATGWQPYDATKIENIGFGTVKNVITNVMMERLAAPNGPTQGRILRPSDGKVVKSIAFVQCAGSRDENHLPFCSTVCCSASLKQTTYIREQYPDSKVYIFYIDLRTPGRLEDFLGKVQSDENVILTKGKVAKVTEDPEKADVIVEAEDTAAGGITRVQVDMVVLATGMEPTTTQSKVPIDLLYDEDGFFMPDPKKRGIYGTGCVKKPMDVASCVQDATGTALKTIQSAMRR